MSVFDHRIQELSDVELAAEYVLNSGRDREKRIKLMLPTGTITWTTGILGDLPRWSAANYAIDSPGYMMLLVATEATPQSLVYLGQVLRRSMVSTANGLYHGHIFPGDQGVYAYRKLTSDWYQLDTTLGGGRADIWHFNGYFTRRGDTSMIDSVLKAAIMIQAGKTVADRISPALLHGSGLIPLTVRWVCYQMFRRIQVPAAQEDLDQWRDCVQRLYLSAQASNGNPQSQLITAFKLVLQGIPSSSCTVVSASTCCDLVAHLCSDRPIRTVTLHEIGKVTDNIWYTLGGQFVCGSPVLRNSSIGKPFEESCSHGDRCVGGWRECGHIILDRPPGFLAINASPEPSPEEAEARCYFENGVVAFSVAERQSLYSDTTLGVSYFDYEPYGFIYHLGDGHFVSEWRLPGRRHRSIQVCDGLQGATLRYVSYFGRLDNNAKLVIAIYKQI